MGMRKFIGMESTFILRNSNASETISSSDSPIPRRHPLQEESPALRGANCVHAVLESMSRANLFIMFFARIQIVIVCVHPALFNCSARDGSSSPRQTQI